jgi:3D (Asp-Asp-Asp) domain-containing protein
MVTTGYDNSYRSTGKNPGDRGYGVTANRTAAGPGTIAAPRNYPYGTVMNVPGYGQGRVEDRGGAIKGSHIDLWFPTEQAALEWGRRNKDVQVCIVKK